MLTALRPSRGFNVASIEIRHLAKAFSTSSIVAQASKLGAQRDPKYTALTKEHVDFFRGQLNRPLAVIDGITADASSDLEQFNADWIGKFRGKSRLVLKPKNVEEVSTILRYCNENKLAVVPQGGNTGLVGGSVPVFDEVIISMVNMNRIRSFDKVSGVLNLDAGVILETANQLLDQQDHVFPLDLGAKGSCHVGGNVATNAGGLRLLRYGSLPGNILGIEAVLPDGTIFDSLSELRKDNTGYSLEQLFIGSEGTLGIITGVSVLCPPRSKAVHLAYLGLESFDQVVSTFQAAKTQLGEILSAFELMDGLSQDIVRDHTGLQHPLEDAKYPFYCLIETRGSNEEHDSAKLEAFLEEMVSNGQVANGTIAQDESQMKSIWRWREDVAEVIKGIGGSYKYDFSIPLGQWYQLVYDCRDRLRERGLLGSKPQEDSYPVNFVMGYGHVGDSNIHINVCVKQYSDEIREALEPWIYEWIQKNKGSVSAEHGVGQSKRPFVQYSRNETNLRLMRKLREAYDTNGIMNPYKYI